MDQTEIEQSHENLLDALDALIYMMRLQTLMSDDMESMTRRERVRRFFDVYENSLSGVFYVGNIYEIHVHVTVDVHEGGAVSLCLPSFSGMTVAAAVAYTVDTRSACDAASQIHVVVNDLTSEMSKEHLTAAIRAEHVARAEDARQADKLN